MRNASEKSSQIFQAKISRQITMKTKVKNSITDNFDKLCNLAEQAYGEELEVSYESTLIDILEFVKINQPQKNELIEKFKGLLTSRNGPFEAVAFCMHELRWPEIEKFAIEKMNSSNDPRSEALRSVVLAYGDDWPDADLYEYYQRKGSERRH